MPAFRMRVPKPHHLCRQCRMPGNHHGANALERLGLDEKDTPILVHTRRCKSEFIKTHTKYERIMLPRANAGADPLYRALAGGPPKDWRETMTETLERTANGVAADNASRARSLKMDYENQAAYRKYLAQFAQQFFDESEAAMKAVDRVPEPPTRAGMRFAKMMLLHHKDVAAGRKESSMQQVFIQYVAKHRPDLLRKRRSAEEIASPPTAAAAPEPSPPPPIPVATPGNPPRPEPYLTTALINIPEDAPSDSVEYMGQLGACLKRIYMSPSKMYDLVSFAMDLGKPGKPGG